MGRPMPTGDRGPRAGRIGACGDRLRLRGGEARHRPDRGAAPVGLPDRGSEAGYNLVALAILIAVMNVAVAAALPYWSSWAQRQKEEELVFRGLQYAEAIRIFRVRQGRLPTALEELVEVEPRAIRQLWTNPMAEDGRWGLLMQGAPSNAGQRGDGSGNAQPTTNAAAAAAAGAGGGSMTAVPPPNEEEGEGPVVGPILGVYSATPGPSMRVFNGQQDVGDWYFTSELIQLRPGNAADGRPPPRLTSEWIGRPFPPGVLDGPATRDGTAPAKRSVERRRRVARPSVSALSAEGSGVRRSPPLPSGSAGCRTPPACPSEPRPAAPAGTCAPRSPSPSRSRPARAV